jgi:hypothetical protein
MENCFPEQGMECESEATEVAIIVQWIDATVLCTVLAMYLQDHFIHHINISVVWGQEQCQNSKCLTTTTGTVICSMVWTNIN